MFFPLFFPSAFNRRMTLLVSSLISLAICSIIWMVLVYFPRRTILRFYELLDIRGHFFSPGICWSLRELIKVRYPEYSLQGHWASSRAWLQAWFIRPSKRKDQIELAVLLYVPLKFRSLVVRFSSDSLKTQTLCPCQLLSLNNKS
jgi:hypothetical protein